MLRDRCFRLGSITLVVCWVGIFALIPHLLILLTSVKNELSWTNWSLTLAHYKKLLNPIYLKVFLQSFGVAGICTACCLLIGYPFAYFLTQLHLRYKRLLLLLVMIPFWTSSLIRTYAIIAILKVKGVLNTTLLALGIIQQPLQLLYTHTMVIIGLVYDLLPFMILPLYANFEKLESRYLDAARDLGASQYFIFFHVIIPLTLPGILAGSLLVFLPAMSLFHIPDILGGAKSLGLGSVIQRQFLNTQDWSLGATLSIFLIGVLGVLLFACGRLRLQKQGKLYQDFL